MGAFERAAFKLTPTGRPQTGTAMTFTVNGPPGLAVLAIGSQPGFDFFLAPFGFLTTNPFLFINTAPGLVNPISMPQPNPVFEGLGIDVQAIGCDFRTTSPARPPRGRRPFSDSRAPAYAQR